MSHFRSLQCVQDAGQAGCLCSFPGSTGLQGAVCKAPCGYRLQGATTNTTPRKGPQELDGGAVWRQTVTSASDLDAKDARRSILVFKTEEVSAFGYRLPGKWLGESHFQGGLSYMC